MSKPVWLTLAEQLVTQAQRDLARQRRRIAKEMQAKHALFNVQVRAHLTQGHQGSHHA